MKNITLSIPDELLERSREYAKKQGTSLNSFVRELLAKYTAIEQTSAAEDLLSLSEGWNISTENIKWNRDELYER